MKTSCFSRRLHDLFTAAAFTHEELAKLLNVSVQTVRQWENGSRVPDVLQFQKIAGLTGLPYDWFLDDPTLSPSEVAALLGLSEDTVLLLSELAAHEPKGVLDAVDDAVYAVLDAIQMAREA